MLDSDHFKIINLPSVCVCLRLNLIIIQLRIEARRYILISALPLELASPAPLKGTQGSTLREGRGAPGLSRREATLPLEGTGNSSGIPSDFLPLNSAHLSSVY